MPEVFILSQSNRNKTQFLRIITSKMLIDAGQQRAYTSHTILHDEHSLTISCSSAGVNPALVTLADIIYFSKILV